MPLPSVSSNPSMCAQALHVLVHLQNKDLVVDIILKTMREIKGITLFTVMVAVLPVLPQCVLGPGG